MLICADVHVEYGAKERLVHALRGVTLQMGRGDALAVMGPSGSGKTTLLKVLGGLQEPTRGSAMFDGRSISAALDAGEIGFVRQDYRLVPFLNVEENILLPVSLRRTTRYSQDDTDEVLSQLGLSSLRLEYPTVLSGGEQQRVAIARALITRPSLVLADEPTGALDETNSEVVSRLLLSACSDYRACLVTVTHDQRVADLFPRIANLQSGAIVEA